MKFVSNEVLVPHQLKHRNLSALYGMSVRPKINSVDLYIEFAGNYSLCNWYFV